jgi:PAS domain S-box-containing protein
MPSAPGRIVLVGLPADVAAPARAGLVASGRADVADLAPQEALADLVRDAEEVAAIVTWDPGAGGGVAFAQRVARIDRDLAVVVVAPSERAEASARAVQFAPFLGEDVVARSTDDLERLGMDVAAAAERTGGRRAAREHDDPRPDAKLEDPERSVAGYAEHVLRHAPFGVAALDSAGVLLAFNAEAARMLAVDADDAIGRRFDDLVGPDRRGDVRRLIASAGGDDPAATAAVRCVLELGGDGERRSIELSVNRYMGPGEALATVVILDDVTARERAAARLHHLQAVTDAALGTVDLDDLLDRLLTRIREALAVEAAAVLLVDETGDSMRLRAFQGLDPALEGITVAIGEGFAGRIALERVPRRLPRVQGHLVASPLVAGLGSLLGVPLTVGGDLIGVLDVGSTAQREFDDDDQILLQLIADRVALAISQARLYGQQYETATVLQRSLLPQRLPDVPGLRLAVRYLPGGPDIDVGGDWYDVTPLGSGHVVLSIGDVVGRGLGAAAIMGHLRAGLRAYSIEGHQPGAALQRLNDLVVHGGRGMATAAHMEWDPDGTLRIARAGHPPPLLVDPDGSARLVEEGGGPALGVMPFASYDDVTVDFPPGARIVLYTDGLVERRGESLDRSLDRLVQAARGAPPGAEALAERLLERLLERDADDDAALLVLEAPPRGPRLELDLPADPEALGLVRTHLRRWLLEHGADRDTVADFVVASGEACTNVIEHAYGPGSASFRLEVSHENGDAVVTVRDSGRWRDGAGEHGTALMRALMDDVTIERGDGGTVVHLRRRIGTPDGVGTA